MRAGDDYFRDVYSLRWFNPAHPNPAIANIIRTRITNGSQEEPPVCGRSAGSAVAPGEPGVDVGVASGVFVGVLVGVGGTGVGVKPAWTIKVGASAADSPMLNSIAIRKTNNNRLDSFVK